MTYWRLYYHLIWITKNRAPIITPELEPVVFRMITHKAKDLEAVVYSINGMPDHIHLAASIPPKIALSDFVKSIKGSTSYNINKKFGMDTMQWQPGYGVVSFGQKHLNTVIDYIEHQKRHHHTGATRDFFETCSNHANRPPNPRQN